MGFQVGRPKGTMSEMNVVPLIDILLVLIIIFMVIAPVTPKGLEALLPQPGEVPPEEGSSLKPIVVWVDAAGLVRINEEKETWATLGPRLEAILGKRQDKVAFVKGDKSVEFSEVARAISIMRSAGVERVGLLTGRLEAGL
jgi:biopolymer transport protein TolR